LAEAVAEVSSTNAKTVAIRVRVMRASFFIIMSGFGPFDVSKFSRLARA
jgi:hypothetical protein